MRSFESSQYGIAGRFLGTNWPSLSFEASFAGGFADIDGASIGIFLSLIIASDDCEDDNVDFNGTAGSMEAVAVAATKIDVSIVRCKSALRQLSTTFKSF